MFRALWEAMAEEHEGVRGTPRQVLLDAQQILELNVELDTIRAGILDRYRVVDRPINPHINAYRLDAGHDLVLTHAQDIAEIIRGTDRI